MKEPSNSFYPKLIFIEGIVKCRNIVVIFQPNILGIVGFYVRHSANNIWFRIIENGNWGKAEMSEQAFLFYGKSILNWGCYFSSHIGNLQTLESSNYFQVFHNGVKRINVDSLFYLNFSDQAAWVYFVGLKVFKIVSKNATYCH